MPNSLLLLLCRFRAETVITGQTAETDASIFGYQGYADSSPLGDTSKMDAKTLITMRKLQLSLQMLKRMHLDSTGYTRTAGGDIKVFRIHAISADGNARRTMCRLQQIDTHLSPIFTRIAIASLDAISQKSSLWLM